MIVNPWNQPYFCYIPVACLETASTGKQGHYFDAVNNKVKFEGDANALKKNKNYHFR